MIFNDDHTRTLEEGHSARCLAAAMIAAIENMRDRVAEDAKADAGDDRTVTPFRLLAQDNAPLTWADEYLVSNTTTCICNRR